MQSQKTLPSGLKLIKVILILSIIFTALGLLSVIAAGIMTGIAQKVTGLQMPVEIFGAAFFMGIIYAIFSIFLSIYVFRAIRKPTIGRYGVTQKLLIVDVLLSIAFIVLSYHGLYANVFGIVISALMIWYFAQVKGYFTTGQIDRTEPRIKKANKTFIILMIIGILASILVPAAIASVSEVSQVKSTMEMVSVFKGKTIQDGVAYCGSLAPDKKDNCYLYLVTMARDDNRSQIFSDKGPVDPAVCSQMSTSGGKDSCYMLINRCDLVIDAKVRSVCQYAASLMKIASTTPR